MIRHMRHGSSPGLMAPQPILRPNRRESLATPSAGDRMMQLTKRTGQDLGGFDRDINEQNIEGGVKLLGKAIGRCGETDFKCLASMYNGSTAAEQSGWAKTARRGHDQLSGATESDFPLPGPAYASANTG